MNIFINNPEELLFTLEICRKHLPSHTNPAHFKRLRGLMEQLKASGVTRDVEQHD